jgi:ABC-type molybdenum transport system ATPase subunit/photorepair protein PhrA
LKATSVRITPTANDNNATIEIDGTDVNSGSTRTINDLSQTQETIVEVVVTAENGIGKTTYTLTINASP